MKTKLLFLLMAVLALNVNAQDLILNGDQEAGSGHIIDNWPSSDNIRQETVYHINGLRSVRLAGLSTGVWYHQDVTVEAGVTYKLTYSGRIQDGAGASGSTTNTGHILIGRVRAGTTSGTWTEVANITSSSDETVSGNYTVPAGITVVRVQLFKANGIGYADDIKFEKVGTGTVIDEIKNESVTVSPNPSSGVFRLSSQETISSYSVFNMSGQELVSYLANNNEVTVDLSTQAKGLYIIKTVDIHGKSSVVRVYLK